MNTLTVTQRYAQMFLANMGTRFSLREIADMNNPTLAREVSALMTGFGMNNGRVTVVITD